MPNTLKKKAERLAAAATNWKGYNEPLKREFKLAATAFLREVAKQLEGGADVRFNPGGIAVSGDAILHADNVYVCMTCTFDTFYFRHCEGRKDYTGGRNQSMSYADLGRDPAAFVEQLKRLAGPMFQVV